MNKHTFWQDGAQHDVPFTPEEEIEREEAARLLRLEMAAESEKTQKVATLEVKLADDSITFSEMKELMRLRG